MDPLRDLRQAHPSVGVAGAFVVLLVAAVVEFPRSSPAEGVAAVVVEVVGEVHRLQRPTVANPKIRGPLTNEWHRRWPHPKRSSPTSDLQVGTLRRNRAKAVAPMRTQRLLLARPPLLQRSGSRTRRQRLPVKPRTHRQLQLHHSCTRIISLMGRLCLTLASPATLALYRAIPAVATGDEVDEADRIGAVVLSPATVELVEDAVVLAGDVAVDVAVVVAVAVETRLPQRCGRGLIRPRSQPPSNRPISV